VDCHVVAGLTRNPLNVCYLFGGFRVKRGMTEDPIPYAFTLPTIRMCLIK
jgi:hypothetical protein